MINLSTIRSKTLRANAQKNKRLHFFSSKFSVYFSWLFINIGLSANQVTIIFFITGLLGSIFILSQDVSFIFISYLLWRLHIIIDLCDGDVARYTQKFSINGAYWDYMIHSILYPLFFINITIALYFKYSDEQFLFLGAFGGLVVSQLLAVKNNYYRSMLFNGQILDKELDANTESNTKFILFDTIRNILSFEGFLFTYVLLNLSPQDKYIYLSHILFYIFVFLAVILIKFISFTRKGSYARRS